MSTMAEAEPDPVLRTRRPGKRVRLLPRGVGVARERFSQLAGIVVAQIDLVLGLCRVRTSQSYRPDRRSGRQPEQPSLEQPQDRGSRLEITCASRKPESRTHRRNRRAEFSLGWSAERWIPDPESDRQVNAIVGLMPIVTDTEAIGFWARSRHLAADLPLP